MTALRGKLQHQVAMARYTTWRVGGPAECLYEPADADDLGAFLASDQAQDPLFWLGLGSNLLVRDGGLRGSVIRLHRGLGQIKDLGQGLVEVDAGVPCAKLARWCGRAGYSGAEFFAGIPGTVGGALAMNAGAWGGETWQHVQSVTTVSRRGQTHERSPQDYTIGYRSVSGPVCEWFTAARLQFSPGGDPQALKERVKSLLDQRGRTQPTGMASGGSVFRNPPGDHAARLIETAGLKGQRQGGAWVSEKHANFIVHEGTASAADIENLIKAVQQRVEQVHGVRLETEVRIVGEVADVRH